MSQQHDPSRDNRLDSRVNAAKTKDEALNLLLEEADRALARLKVTAEPTERKLISADAKVLLSRAEHIKASGVWKDVGKSQDARVAPKSTRQLSKTEQIILLKGSFVSGCKFPPWQQAPSVHEFGLAPDGEPYVDTTELRLSQTQLTSLHGWLRPEEARERRDRHSEPTITSTSGPEFRTIDLVQDAATDCSVVASLCALIARAEKGHEKLMGDWFYPYDEKSTSPAKSSSGKYIGRLNFNGAFRRVEVDDRLPISNNDRAIHVLDRNHPCLLWPAMIEKMYLKVRGGYDFPGSNSSTDLWILTGWIPEQIFLESDEVFPSEIWKRIWNAHTNGDVMVTLGTGKMSFKAERGLGLASEHSYAVLDMREEQGQQLMLVKNPWAEGSTWRRDHRRKPVATDGSQDIAVQSPRDLLNEDRELFPESFWMDFPNVIQHFESIYLNWNPALYGYREDIHFAWSAKDNIYPGTYLNNPQFSFTIRNGGSGCVLLNRHFQSDKSSSKGSIAPDTNEIFMRLLMFDAGGKRVMLKQHVYTSTPFVASHHALLHLTDLQPGAQYTLVVDQDGETQYDHAYTLCIFSNSAVRLDTAAEPHPSTTSLMGSWNDRNAGGNPSSPSFSINPQFRIAIAQPTAISITLACVDKDVPVNVKLCFSEGKRVHSVRSRDVIVDSHDYRPACTEARSANVDAEIYTIVCSTYEVGQYGDFILRVDSEHPVQMRAFPNESAGLLRTAAPDATFSHEEQAQAILLLPQRLTKLMTVVKHRPVAGSAASGRSQRSMIRLSVKQGDAFEHRIIAVSSDGEYRDSLGGTRIDSVDLSPAMSRDADLWLVLERNCTARQLEDESFSVEFWTDVPDAIQTGDWQEWDEM